MNDDFGAAFFLFLTIVVVGFAGAFIEGAILKSECKNFGYMAIGVSRYECKLAELPK